MKTICLLLAAMVLLGAGPKLGAEQMAEPEQTGASLSQGVNQFAFDLYQQLPAGEKNLLFSPYSIAVAMAMAYAGAEGETEAEIRQVLHFNSLKKDLAAEAQTLINHFNKVRSKTGALYIANAIWPQKDFPLKNDYLETLKKYYLPGVTPLDFINEPDKARETINNWTAQQTNDKIKNMLTPGVLTTETRLVLTNAIYFKGAWRKTFLENDTKNMPFYVSEKRKVPVPMMQMTDTFNYGETERFQVIELPYACKPELSMVILLPKDKYRLSRKGPALSLSGLDADLAKLKPKEIKLRLPKFQFSYPMLLTEVLQKMGIKQAFSIENADFSGITGKKDLFISAVLHKAFIEVNEQDTEAGAITDGIIMGGEPIVFRADHPFVFLIRDPLSGAILFLGRMSNPEK